MHPEASHGACAITGDVRGGLQIRAPAQVPARPDALRIRLPELRKTAQPDQAQSDTLHAGTEQPARLF